MAILSKEITLKYDAVGTTGTQTYTKIIKDVLEIPDLGDNLPEKVDITTLGDSEKKYMDGLEDNTQDLQIKLLHSSEQYATIAALNGAEQAFQITLPADDGTSTATFTGKPYIKLSGLSVGGTMEDVLTIRVTSKIVFA